jgi:hypothetical protein
MFRPTVSQIYALRQDLTTAIVLLRASKRKPTVAQFLKIHPLTPPLKHLEPAVLQLTLEQFLIYMRILAELTTVEEVGQ